jgi:hypothetical protein
MQPKGFANGKLWVASFFVSIAQVLIDATAAYVLIDTKFALCSEGEVESPSLLTFVLNPVESHGLDVPNQDLAHLKISEAMINYAASRQPD